MICPRCGAEHPADKKFCTACGARFGETTTEMPVVPPAPPVPPSPHAASPGATQAMPGVPVVPVAAVAGAAPAAIAEKRKMKRGTKVTLIVAAVVVFLCIVAAAIVIPLVIAAANKPIANITTLKLVRTDGESLDMKQVPLDTEVALRVTYKARFKQDGSGVLKVAVTEPGGTKLIDKSYDVTSSDKPQSKDVKYTMTRGSGKPLTARAVLTVLQGKTKLTGTRSLAYTAVEGKGAELQLEEAKDAALKKCQEATSAVTELSSLGIQASDLADRLSKAVGDLKAATTAAQANAVAATAQGVIDECNARKASAQQQQAHDQDVASAKQVMFNYANAEKGNAESIELADFSMNDAGTVANATYRGMVTVHTDPTNAGQIDYFYVTAEKQGGQWVVTNFRYEFVQ